MRGNAVLMVSRGFQMNNSHNKSHKSSHNSRVEHTIPTVLDLPAPSKEMSTFIPCSQGVSWDWIGEGGVVAAAKETIDYRAGDVYLKREQSA